MSCVQPTAASRTSTSAERHALVLRLHVWHIDHLPWLERSKKLPHRINLKLGVCRADKQEKSIARSTVELRNRKQRMVRHGQAVQGQHSKHARQRRPKHRTFEGDRNK